MPNVLKHGWLENKLKIKQTKTRTPSQVKVSDPPAPLQIYFMWIRAGGSKTLTWEDDKN